MNEKAYTTIENIKNYLTIEIVEAFEDQIDDWITAMSNHVRLATNRDWLADETATERFFDGNGMRSIEVGDFIGTPVLKVGSDFNTDMVASTDFASFPYNTTSKNTLIHKSYGFPRGIQNVSVTARWGYMESVPKDIQLATTILVAGIILAQTNQEGEVKSETIGNYTVSYATEKQISDFENAKKILDYRTLIRI